MESPGTDNPIEPILSPTDASSTGDSGQHRSITGDIVNVIRGFCMGSADTVPGVSGGTVALILGHYHRLVNAIGQVNSDFIRLLAARQIKQAFYHIDGRFCVALGLGIAIGIVSMSGLMHWLLDRHLPETLAVFLGLMLASVWIVKSYVQSWSAGSVCTLILGIVVAVAITLLPESSGSLSLPYLFISASVAICAMILPGISGAFVLLLFGIYHSVTGLIKDAAKGNITVESLTQIIVFTSGCLFGLLAFSRLLKWLLEHHRDVTMAGLMGLMIGSIRKLWPLQLPTPETANDELKFRVMEYFSPGQWQGSLVTIALLIVVSAIVVLAAEHVAKSSKA